MSPALTKAIKVLKQLHTEAVKEHQFWTALRAAKKRYKEPTYAATRNATIWGNEAAALQIAIDGLFRLSQLES